MAIRIRCKDCGKKISIDEAFAGGMCRCPYCKALVYVDEASGVVAKAAARPDAPATRPAAPGQAGEPVVHSAGPSANLPPDAEHVPMARPVKIQGIITIILLVLLVLMVGGGITTAMFFIPGDGPGNGDVPPPPGQKPTINQITKSGPGIVDITIATPVIYLLDGGSGMRSAFDSARMVTMRSVETLGGEKYNILVSTEGEDKLLSPDYVPGDREGMNTLKTFLQSVLPMGASNIPRSLKAAIDKKPKSIVLFTRKPVDNAMSLAETAKAQGTVIHTITIESDSEVIDSMKRLAETSGGEARDFLGGG